MFFITTAVRLKTSVGIEKNKAALLTEGIDKTQCSTKVSIPLSEWVIKDRNSRAPGKTIDVPNVTEVRNNFLRNFTLFTVYLDVAKLAFVKKRNLKNALSLASTCEQQKY